VSHTSAAGNYSLWIVPGGEAYDRLSRIIYGLGALNGAPDFCPHVTLLGRLAGPPRELASQAQRVAATLRPFMIRLEKIDFRDEYFRSLFVHAVLNEPLRNAHEAACQAMARRREPPFMPHLSLLYGNFQRCFKEEVIAELGPRLETRFKVRSLHLYRTQGDPRRWRRLASFGLK